MTPTEEQEMHKLTLSLAALTEGTGWEAARYVAIAMVLNMLSEYCATCACQAHRNFVKRSG